MKTEAVNPSVQQELVCPQTLKAAVKVEPTTTDLQVELIQDYPSFVALEPVWNRLVDEAGIDHPFLRHEWVRTWWDCFKPEGSLFIVLVTEGSKTVAIAPLMLDHGRMYGFPVRRLRG